MKIFKVGGCVRDYILGEAPNDIDYVVVGSTPEIMLKKGFNQVGKNFPVFLHPETKEEYALARLERKKGNGHKGFEFNFSPNITLEQDLLRRDLTINAIAQDLNGNIYDPYNGLEDLKNKVLRHVSEYFKDDPLRVLRLARFKAKYSDFTIAEETISILREINDSDEIKFLSNERVIKELIKALKCDNFMYYFKSLQLIGSNSWFKIEPFLPIFNEDRDSDIKLDNLEVFKIHDLTKNKKWKEKLLYIMLKTLKSTDIEYINYIKDNLKLFFSNDLLDFFYKALNIYSFIKKQNNSNLEKPSLEWFNLFSLLDIYRKEEDFFYSYNEVLFFIINNENNIKMPNESRLKYWLRETYLNVGEFLKMNRFEKSEIKIKILNKKNEIINNFILNY